MQPPTLAPADAAAPRSPIPSPVAMALTPSQRWLLFGIAIVVLSGFLITGLPLQVVPLFVHGGLGFGPFAVGIAMSLQACAALLSRAPAGALIDRHGPRRAIVLGMFFAVAGAAAYPLAEWAAGWPVWSYAILLLGRALIGVAESLLVGGALGWGVAALGPQHTGRVMVWVGVSLYAAIGLGSPVGIQLYREFRFGGVAIAMVIATLAALTLVLRLPAPALPGGRRIPFYRVLGLVWCAGCGLALGTAGFAGLCAFGALIFAQRGWDHAIWLVPAFTAAYLLPRLFLSGLPDRLGGARVALACLAVEALGLSLLAGAGSPAIAIVGSAITGLGFSLVFPSFGREAVLRVPPASRGSALSAYVAFFDVSLAAAAPLMGLASIRCGLAAAFWGGALAAIGGLFCAAALLAARERSAA